MTSSGRAFVDDDGHQRRGCEQDQADEALVRQRLDERPPHRRARVQRDRDRDQHIADREAGGGRQHDLPDVGAVREPRLRWDRYARGRRIGRRPAAQSPSVADGRVESSAMQRLPLGRGRSSNVAVACSSTATGSPQTISAAKLNVTEASGASRLERPGVTIGQISPSTTMPASTQNSGCPMSVERCTMWITEATNTTAPTSVTKVMWIHSGEPTRGPMSLVSVGSFMAPHRPAVAECAALGAFRESYGKKRTSRSQLHTICYNLRSLQFGR